MVDGAGNTKCIALPERWMRSGADESRPTCCMVTESEGRGGGDESVVAVFPTLMAGEELRLCRSPTRGDSKSAKEPGELTSREMAEDDLGDASCPGETVHSGTAEELTKWEVRAGEAVKRSGSEPGVDGASKADEELPLAGRADSTVVVGALAGLQEVGIEQPSGC